MKRSMVPAAVVAAFLAVNASADGMPKGKEAAGVNKGDNGPIAQPAEGVHGVVGGDTLWGLSGKYWHDTKKWPKLWSLNPHIRNPHWLYLGDKVYLAEPPPPPVPEPVVREIQLVVEKLKPAPEVDESARKKAEEQKVAKAEAPPPRPTVNLMERRSQDYVSAERPARLGEVMNARAMKIMSAETEELEFTPASGSEVKAGDMLTIFDDRREIAHPVTGAPAGRQVRVLGHLKVLSVDKDKGLGRITSSYDVIEDGNGLMPYRQPVLKVEKGEGAKGVDGLILGGHQKTFLFSAEDVVFLDKGKEDGLTPGSLVSVPLPEGRGKADGYTDDLEKPIARAIVVSTQPRTSTALITESRKAVEAGFRFTASADSP